MKFTIYKNKVGQLMAMEGHCEFDGVVAKVFDLEGSALDKIAEENNHLRDKLARYREALGFYADRNNWKFYSYSNDCKDMIEFSDVGVKSYNEDADHACGSGGRRAREALKGE